MRPTASFLRFTDSQRHALDARRNLVVRANAGSGKTAVLVERIVQLLAGSWDQGSPLDIGQVVAITFTRKAAAELQERLREAFGPMRAGLGEGLGEGKAEGERAFWRRQLLGLPRAMIGTIDRFCAHILREYSPSGETAHVPESEPLDEFEEALLKRQCVERLVERLRTVTDPRLQKQTEACLWWLQTHGREMLTGHLLALLNHLVDPEEVVAAHRDGPSVEERLEAMWSTLPAVRHLRTRRAELATALAAIQVNINQLDRTGVGARELGEQCGRLIDLLGAPALEDEEAVLRGLAEAFFRKDGGPRSQGLAQIEPQVRPLQAEWEELLRDFDFDRQAERSALEAAGRLACLLGPAQADYLRSCEALNRFDFLTLARRARDLLRASPQACAEIKKRYRYFLIDEFQDTNDLQWEIIARLVGSGPEGGLDRDRLFMVGDPQQSIYRFRNADVGVFHRVQALVLDGNRGLDALQLPTAYDDHRRAALRQPGNSTPVQRLGLMTLQENFRSLSPLPLELMDQVFRYVFDPVRHQLDPANNAFEVLYQPLTPGLAPSEPGLAGEIRYVLPEQTDREEAGADADNGGETESPEDEHLGDRLGPSQVELVVDQLIALHGKPKRSAQPDKPATLGWNDMAVLLPSRKTVLRELEKEFRRRGVPFMVTRGIGFWQRQEVRDIVNLATCLADPCDSLGLFATLRGPLGQLTDAEILFLHQLGKSSSQRGLQALASVSTSYAPATHLWEFWDSLPDERRKRLRRTAGDLHCWRKRVDRLDHADLLERCLEESNAWAIYASEPEGDQVLANLDRLFGWIRAEESRTAPTLARLARSLRERRDHFLNAEQAGLAAGKDAVQIMTVHAAKGLEFPVVAVLKLDRPVGSEPLPRLMVVNRRDHWLPADASGLPVVRAGTIAVSVRRPRRPRDFYRPRMLRALHNLERAQQLAESRRLFYVAATRAAERLILASGQPNSQRPSWQRWFEDALGITDIDKKNGQWRSADGRLEVTIVTRLTESRPGNGLRAKITLPVGTPVDLEPIAE